MATLDIFNNDAFSVTNLTKTINDTPYLPSRIGSLGLFSEEGIATTSCMIEKVGNTVNLVGSHPRGAPPTPVTREKRTLLPISTVHLPQRGTIMADEIQNVRAFGSESDVETISNLVTRRLAKMRRNTDVTIEWQRLGAIKGQVLDSDGSTVLLDLFNTFGVSQQTFDMGLDVTSTNVKLNTIAVKRLIENELGGVMYRGLRAFCSPGFFDDLVGHSAVEAAFDRWMSGEFLRTDQREGFYFAGVFWEEYRGTVDSHDFIADGTAYLVPEGIPDLFTTYYAPADYMETVNTIGVPYYAKQEAMAYNKGVEIEVQSNPISICTRPRSVVKLTAA